MNETAQEAERILPMETAVRDFYERLLACKMPRPAMLCLWLVFKRSLARGRTRAWFPKHAYFVGALKMDKHDVSFGLKWLAERGLIDRPRSFGGKQPEGWYAINIGSWNVTFFKLPQFAEETLFAFEEPEPDLPEALRLTYVNLDFGGDELPTKPRDTGTAPVARPGSLDAVRDVHASCRPVGAVVVAGPMTGNASHGPGETSARPLSAADGDSPDAKSASAGTAPANSTGTASAAPGTASDRVGWENPNSTETALAAGVEKVVGKIPTPVGKVVGKGVGNFPTAKKGFPPCTPLPKGTTVSTVSTVLRDYRPCREGGTGGNAEVVGKVVGKFPTAAPNGPKRASWGEEAWIMNELREFFAVPTAARWDHEMDRCGEQFWRARVVRNCYAALETALADGRSKDADSNWKWEWKPAWLVREVIKLSRFKTLSGLRPGPEPEGPSFNLAINDPRHLAAREHRDPKGGTA